MYLRLQPPNAILGDALEPLTETWIAVQSKPSALLDRLDSWTFDRATYERLREQVPSSDVDRAARFLYLNRGAYGGLWRLNRQGKFNVPWSDPKTESSLDRANLLHVSALLNRGSTSIENKDFADLTARAQPGDFVFLDPPYSKGRAERPFIHYNETLFDWDAQVRLAAEARRLARSGVHVLVTNSAHTEIAELFGDFAVVELSRHNSLGSPSAIGRKLPERAFVSR